MENTRLYWFISMLICCTAYLSFLNHTITTAILGVVTIIFGFIDTYMLWDNIVFSLYGIDKRIDEFPLVFVEDRRREYRPARIYKGSEGYYHIQIYYTYDKETTDKEGKKVTKREEHYLQKRLDISKIKQFYVNLFWSHYFPVVTCDVVIHNIIDEEDNVILEKLPLVSGNNSKFNFDSININKYPRWYIEIKKLYDDYFYPDKYLDIVNGIFIEK